MANKRIKITELPKIEFYGYNTHPAAAYNSDNDSSKTVHKEDEAVIAVHDITPDSTTKTTYSISMEEIQRFVLQRNHGEEYDTETLVIGRSAEPNVDGKPENACKVQIAGDFEVLGAFETSATAGSFSTENLTVDKVTVNERLTITDTADLRINNGGLLHVKKGGTLKVNNGTTAITLGESGSIVSGVGGRSVLVADTTSTLNYNLLTTSDIYYPDVTTGEQLTTTLDNLNAQLATLEGIDHTQNTDTELDAGVVEVTDGDYTTPDEVATPTKRVVLNDASLVLPKHPNAEDLTVEDTSKTIKAVIGEVRWNVYEGVPTLYLAVSGHPDVTADADAKSWYGIPLFGDGVID